MCGGIVRDVRDPYGLRLTIAIVGLSTSGCALDRYLIVVLCCGA